MQINKAIETVKEYYELARQATTRDGENIIHDPVAWALYQTWITADEDRRKKVNDGKKNQE